MLAKDLLVREEESLVTTEEQVFFSQEEGEVEVDLAEKAKETLGYTPLILEQERNRRENKKAKDRFLFRTALFMAGIQPFKLKSVVDYKEAAVREKLDFRGQLVEKVYKVSMYLWGVLVVVGVVLFLAYTSAEKIAEDTSPYSMFQDTETEFGLGFRIAWKMIGIFPKSTDIVVTPTEEEIESWIRRQVLDQNLHGSQIQKRLREMAEQHFLKSDLSIGDPRVIRSFVLRFALPIFLVVVLVKLLFDKRLREHLPAKRVFWKLISVKNYAQPIPESVLQDAVNIGQRNSELEFFVDNLMERELPKRFWLYTLVLVPVLTLVMYYAGTRLSEMLCVYFASLAFSGTALAIANAAAMVAPIVVDPFLVVRHKDYPNVPEEYYVCVWDEPKFEGQPNTRRSEHLN